MPSLYQEFVKPKNNVIPSATAYQAIVTGAAPQWGDDSDATYCLMPSHRDVGINWTSSAYSELNAADIVWPTFTVTAYLRIGCAAGLQRPEVWVTKNNAGEPTLYSNLTGGGSLPTSAGWITVPLAAADSAAPDTLVSLMSAADVRIWLRSPWTTSDTPVGTYDTYVYEAWLQLDRVVSYYTAPPCRMIGRGDDLGVGAGRNYPPPKSQQRSSRGVGFY